MKQRLLLLCLLFVGNTAFAFNVYNQKLLSYKGGVISELNNCGPTYTSNGKYLVGQRNLTASLSKYARDIDFYDNVSSGVASFLSDGRLYYSPNGKYLTGGGGTKYLGTFSDRYSYKQRTHTIYKDYIVSIGTYGNKIVLVRAKKDKDYPNIEEIIGYRMINRYQKEPVYAKGYYHEVSVFTVQSDGGFVKDVFAEVSGRRLDRILGGVGGKLYGQFSDGDIAYFDHIQELEDFSESTTIHAGAQKLRRVKEYANGVLAFGDNVAYTSTHTDRLISGSGVSRIYSGSKTIADLLNYFGDKSSAYGGSVGLIAAFTDGNIYYAPNGRNLVGGGKTELMVKPFKAPEAKENLTRYLNGLVSGGALIKVSDGYYNPQTGHQLNMSDLSVSLINFKDTRDFSKNLFAFDGTASSRVFSIISDFSGAPAKVQLYDKGWDGVEYKWRNRGVREGVVDHSVSGTFIGVTEIRMRASYGCVVAASYEQIGGSGEGFNLGDWELNADFSVANSPAGYDAIDYMFIAPGDNGFFRETYDDYDLLPSGYTLNEIIAWASYNANVYVKGETGHPLIEDQGLPIYLMESN